MTFGAHLIGLSLLGMTVAWSLIGRGLPVGDLAFIILGSLSLVVAGSVVCTLALIWWNWHEDGPPRRSYNDEVLDSIAVLLLGRRVPRAWYSPDGVAPRRRRDALEMTWGRNRLLIAAAATILSVLIGEAIDRPWSIWVPLVPLAAAGYLALTVARRSGHTGLGDGADAGLRFLVYLAATFGVVAYMFSFAGTALARWWIVFGPAFVVVFVLLWLRARPKAGAAELADVFD